MMDLSINIDLLENVFASYYYPNKNDKVDNVYAELKYNQFGYTKDTDIDVLKKDLCCYAGNFRFLDDHNLSKKV